MNITIYNLVIKIDKKEWKDFQERVKKINRDRDNLGVVVLGTNEIKVYKK